MKRRTHGAESVKW